MHAYLKGFVYILKSDKTGKYYIGSSDNPERRLETQHNIGFVRSTRSGIPWKLVYSEEYEKKEDAQHRETEIKSHKSRQYIIDLIQ